MPEKNILITGGAGFIGSHLIDRLLSENRWSVVVVDNFNNFYSPKLKLQNISPHLYNSAFKLVGGDICNKNSLERLFKEIKFDAIVHLAARAGVRPSLKHPDLYFQTNVDGTLNLLELAKNYNVRKFVFGSSSSVYGNNSKVPFKEKHPIFNPISPYAATKAAGELLCHTYSHLYGLRCLCLRFFTVYGARQRPDLAIHKFAKLISERKAIPVFGDGKTKRDYTYIDDIISGIRAAIDYEKTNYEVFNLGESKTIQLIDLIRTLEEELGVPAKLNFLPSQPGDVRQTFADISKAKKLLGYHPKTNFRKGIFQFVKWFKQVKKISVPTVNQKTRGVRIKSKSRSV